MSCDKKNRAVKLAQAKLDEVTAALAEATKQEQDEEKKQADAEAGFIMFVVSSEALGLVSKCRIEYPYCGGGPTWVILHTTRFIRGTIRDRGCTTKV